MKKRFLQCFSDQITSRIVFKPDLPNEEVVLNGSTEHFVKLISESPEKVFFMFDI